MTPAKSSVKISGAETLPLFDDAPQQVRHEPARDRLTIKEASEWATAYLKKQVTTSNISYLIQYGRIKKHDYAGNTAISKAELTAYYESYYKREAAWKTQLGDDLNWQLSFDTLKETDTTKHVHRLHPYKGKFIPQLAEYFLDDHIDEFKREVYFQKGDAVLDVFCGSGTTLVQANELGIHAVGIDVSAFNALISTVKISAVDAAAVSREVQKISSALRGFLTDARTLAFRTLEFDRKLTEALQKFNAEYFPSPEFKRKVSKKLIDEDRYAAENLTRFLPRYERWVTDYSIPLRQKTDATFLDKWYLQPVRDEIDFVYRRMQQIEDEGVKKLVSVILSRTIRTCRATTHADLSTLKQPVTAPYYCAKHGKVCKPLFSIQAWWETYCKDALVRLREFDALRTPTYQACLTGDSRSIDMVQALEKQSPELAALIKRQKIKGIFSSPPYVGLIDYHEQHAYAYDLFGFERQDAAEIGRLFHGQGKAAKASYVEGISAVLKNSRRFLTDDFDVFLVANDKHNLYPDIADKSEMSIVNRFKRPVLNRTEKDKGAYSETVFHLKAKS